MVDFNDFIVGYFDIQRSEDGKRITLVVERADDQVISGDDACNIILQFIETNGDNLEELINTPAEGQTIN